jgi:hypothetical protein
MPNLPNNGKAPTGSVYTLCVVVYVVFAFMCLYYCIQYSIAR